jgi:hypothetical protein
MEFHDLVNHQIYSAKQEGNPQVGLVSDGYHTFDELYESRNILWIKLCELYMAGDNNLNVWRTLHHSDGSSLEGWFLLGIGLAEGNQMTFHLPLEFWTACDFADTLTAAPPFDGHHTQDVLRRVAQL